MIRVLLLFLLAATLFIVSRNTGRYLRKFLFSHFSDSEDEENSLWGDIFYWIKVLFVSVFLVAFFVGLLFFILYAQYNLGWFEW